MTQRQPHRDHISAYDAVIIGAGAAGLFAGIQAARRGRRTVVIDHSKKPAEKIRISGGGRCNFTNIHAGPDRFLSNNRHFHKSALARYTPDDFLDHMRAHGLTWHEKTLGQLFCDQKSGAIITSLLDDLAAAGGQLWLDCPIKDIVKNGDLFTVQLEGRSVTAAALIIATGGLSIPKIGATGFAYDIARQFGHSIIDPVAGLVPFTFTDSDKAAFAALAGVAHPVRVSCGKTSFDEALLFTHRGLSGPAILQISSYWQPGAPVTIDLLGQTDSPPLRDLQRQDGRQKLGSVLKAHIADRLLDDLTARFDLVTDRPLAELAAKTLDRWDSALRRWSVKPSGTEGWRTAEVTLGGIDTDGLSSKTMESKHMPGLYFIGECVDVTGWLGGYNFQWAWASGWVAGHSV